MRTPELRTSVAQQPGNREQGILNVLGERFEFFFEAVIEPYRPYHLI